MSKMKEEVAPEQTAPAAHRSAPTGDEPVKKSPREWAFETGNAPKKVGKNVWTSKGMSPPRGSMAHEVASVLHGWREHEHHENEPFLLTKEEYLAALEAAMPKDEVVEKDGKKHVKFAGNPKPHDKALSKHRGGRVRVTRDGGETVVNTLNGPFERA